MVPHISDYSLHTEAKAEEEEEGMEGVATEAGEAVVDGHETTTTEVTTKVAVEGTPTIATRPIIPINF